MSNSETLSPANRAARRGKRDRVRVPVPRAYVGIIEAADYLDVSVKTIRRMIARGELTTYKYGNRVVKLKLSDLDGIYT